MLCKANYVCAEMRGGNEHLQPWIVCIARNEFFIYMFNLSDLFLAQRDAINSAIHVPLNLVVLMKVWSVANSLR